MRISQIIAGGLILGASVLTAGCGGGGGSSNNNIQSAGPSITLDNAGVVPVLNNSTTTSVIYVHNNGDVAVSGISYSATSNVASNTSTSDISGKLAKLFGSNASNTFLSPQSTALCSTLAAHSSCPLTFTTPLLTASQSQGSALVALNYTVNSHQQTFTQVISFQEVSSLESGVRLNSGVSLSGFGNDRAYGTVYLYGSGSNRIYNITSLSTNKSGVSIANGNINGQELASNAVQAIELSAPVTSQAYFATLSVTATTKGSVTRLATKNNLTQGEYSDSSSIGVLAQNSGPILVSGQIPVINSSSVGAGGTLLITNSGNQAALLSSVQLPVGVSLTSKPPAEFCSAGLLLAVGASCGINFTVTQQGGSGTITLSYTSGSSGSGGTVAASVIWYNGKGGAKLTMQYSNPMTFPQSSPQTNLVTVTNVGGYDLTNVTIPTPIVISGNATSSISYPGSSSCQNATLAVGGSCEFILNITDGTLETNQQLQLGVSGSYNNGSSQTYSLFGLLTYSAVASAANLSISPNPGSTMTIQGNNVESTSQTVTITNSGNIAATILSQGISGADGSYFTSVTNPNPCATIAAESSCTATIKLLPHTAESALSGNAQYVVSYQNGATTATAIESIPYQITANSQGLNLTAIASVGSESGSGTSADPYVYKGNATTQTLTLTYTNPTGNNPVKISGIQDGNSAYTWGVDGKNSTCNNFVNTPLAAGSSCTVVYSNVLKDNILALGGIGASYTENLTLPTFILQDAVATGTQFSVQPSASAPISSTTISAVAHVATVTNSVSVTGDGSANAKVTVSSMLTNASGYSGAITVTTQIESYFSGVASQPDNCGQSSANSMTTQSCMLSSVNNVGSITYNVNTPLIINQGLTLTALFGLDASSQAVSMSPLAIRVDLSQKISEGTLVYVGEYSSGGSQPQQVTISHDGKFAYVANYTSGTINMFSIESTTGGLTPLFPASIAADQNTSAVSLSPDGKFAYTISYSSGIASMYSVESTSGQLTALDPPTLNLGVPNVPGLAVLPNYTYNISYSSSWLSIGITSRDGTTGLLSEPRLSTSVGCIENIMSTDLAVIPDGRYLYLACSDHTLHMASIASSGAPVALSPATISDGLTGGYPKISLSPDGYSAYVIDRQNGGISTFSISLTNGQLTRVGDIIPTPDGSLFNRISFSPDGKFAYASVQLSAGGGDIVTYSRDLLTGVLTLLNDTTTGDPQPQPVTVSPDGKFAYVSDSLNNNIAVFKRITN